MNISNFNKDFLLLQEKLNTLYSDLQLSKDEKHLLVEKNINLEVDLDHLKSELAESNKKMELCNVAVSGKERECAELLSTIRTLESDKIILQTSVDSQVILWQKCFVFSFKTEMLYCKYFFYHFPLN